MGCADEGNNMTCVVGHVRAGLVAWLARGDSQQDHQNVSESVTGIDSSGVCHGVCAMCRVHS